MTGCHSHAHDKPTAAAVDPVCGMSVDPATTAYRLDHAGATVYFCSQQCRDEFVAEPGRFTVTARRPVVPAAGIGLLGSLALLTIFFALLTALSGWEFTLDQFREFWPYLIALATGFGIQVGLFMAVHRAAHAAHAGKVVAVTGSTSGIAMLSCCAHYLITLLPALGAAGVVAFVSRYQVEVFWFGLAANLAGIVYIGRQFLALRRVGAVLALVLAVAVIAVPWGALAQALPPQVNKDGQVTVKVTPLALDQGAWKFQVVFDTHVVPLDQDLLAVAALVAPDGREEKPVAWEGDPPGGHHRNGVLVFRAMSPAPQSVLLKIRDVGAIPERSFTWSLGSR